MTDHIPREVMANILLRLRMKDLFSCRCVSKQWLSIIEDPDFIRSQRECALSRNSNSVLFLQDRTSPRLLYWKHKYASDDDISFSSSAPTCLESTQVQLMGSCHGLVCYSLFNDFVLLNLTTGERHTLSNPSKEGRPIGDRLKAYGFGYDELSDDYKVVRILETNNLSNCSYVAEIYGVRSKGFFRTIPFPIADWRNYAGRKFIGVFFGTSLHWCIRNSVREHVIHAIDLVSNTYRQLQLPRTGFGRVYFLNVGIVDGRLCVCGFLLDEREIGIWVMEEYGNPESWNRIYSVQNYDCGLVPLAVTSVGSIGGKILLMVNSEILVWFDPTKKNVSRTDRNFYHKPHEAVYCLESLVKIFPNDVKKDACDKQLTQSAQ
ncbi:F-box protein CPR1 [Linum grandiflorum]